MSHDDPESWGGRLLNCCLAILFAAMALYGAVAILKSIWLALCIGAAVVAIIAGVGWLIAHRIRRW